MNLNDQKKKKILINIKIYSTLYIQKYICKKYEYILYIYKLTHPVLPGPKIVTLNIHKYSIEFRHFSL